MKCQTCNIEVEECNYVVIPIHKKTSQGVIASTKNVILCDTCVKKVTGQIIGIAKVVDGEIVINGTL